MQGTVTEAARIRAVPALIEAALGGEVSLLGAVSLAEATDPLALDGESRVDLLRLWERVEAMVAGRKQLALAAVIEATTALGLTGEDARHEVGAALRLAPTTAATRTQVAADLRDRLPATLTALCRGDISYLQAVAVADGVRPLPDDLARAVEGRVLAKAADLTIAETRREVLRAVLAADPEAVEERHTKAVNERCIDRTAMADAMEGWWFALPAHTAADMWARVSTEARERQVALRAAGLDDPGLDALRLDCLVDAALGPGAATRNGGSPALLASDADPGADSGADASDDPTPNRRAGLAAAAVDGTPLPRCSCGGNQVAAVVLDLPTALGLADNPGEIPGHGPIPGPMARAMAEDRDWVRWTTDPGTAHLIDRGSATYRPSESMRAFIAARDRVCGFPGCNQRAQKCDCDHIVSFGLPDGRTIRINLGPLCRQHHNAKTHGRWTLRYDPETRLKTWTSPLGKTYTTGTDPPLR